MPLSIKDKVQQLFDDQLASWPLAKSNYEALAQVRTKELEVNGNRYKVQFNPARITSSAAKVDPKSIQERKCFLCSAHLPAEQKGLDFGNNYTILINPFPIFPQHLTIPDKTHTDQRILPRITDMLTLAQSLDNYVIFYNGPKCGASAPDHMHFQAGNKGFLPIEEEWRNNLAGKVIEIGKSTLWYLNDAPRTTLLIESGSIQEATDIFGLVYRSMDILPGEDEPMMNVLAWYESGKWIVCVFPREKHRPSCYTLEGDGNMLISPASVDMGGVFITPLKKDFLRISAADIDKILSEVCLPADKFQQLKQRIKAQL